MIRFACPGCDAAFTVSDEKAGKTGKCPKCATQFIIPDAPAPDALAPPPPPPRVPAPPSGNVAPPPRPVPPPPPPADDGEDIEIDPCPGCKRRLSVARSDLGGQVECPYCQTVYTATKPGTGKSSALSDALSGAGRDRGGDDDRTSRRRRDEDEADDRPARRRREPVDADDEDRPSRRRARDDDEDEDDAPRPRRRPRYDDEDRPSRRRSGRRRGGAPHRGVLILILGIFTICCWCILGPINIILARNDLAEMDRGDMDDSGRGLTMAGMIISIIIMCLGAVGTIVRIAAIAAGAGR